MVEIEFKAENTLMKSDPLIEFFKFTIETCYPCYFNVPVKTIKSLPCVLLKYIEFRNLVIM